MVNYRRNFVPGGTYFFTVALLDRSSRRLTEHIELLRAAFCAVKRKQLFHVDAIVILPDHLHTIWTLPEGDANYPGRWRAIKSAFTRAVVKSGVAVECKPREHFVPTSNAKKLIFYLHFCIKRVNIST